jgi:hypothetical protein
MNKERLHKLAAFLDTLDNKDFDYSTYVSELDDGCGTVCCAVGWLPKLFPEDWRWTGKRLTPQAVELRGRYYAYPSDAASEFFDIPQEDGEALFVDAAKYMQDANYRPTKVTPAMLARFIRQYIEYEYIYVSADR